MSSAFIISLKIVTTAVILATFFCLGLAWKTSNRKNKLKTIIEWLVMMPIFFPPSAIGYIVLMTFGKNGPIGRVAYEFFNTRIIFTWYAGVITTFIIIVPILYKSIKNGFNSIDKELKEASKELGATKMKNFIYVELPLIKNYIYSGLILAFGRGFGEFGAVMMVSGNIPKKTQTIPMALYSAVESGDYIESDKIMITIISVSLICIVLYNYLIKKGRK